MFSLKGKVALVTGSTKGIGKSIATLFASEGAKLVLSDIDDATVQATAAQLAKEKGVDFIHQFRRGLSDHFHLHRSTRRAPECL